jgi:hypothetical protein
MGFDLHINLNLSLDVNTGLPFVWGNNLEKKPYVPSDLEVPLKYRKWVWQRGHHFHYYIRSINESDLLSSTNVEHFLEKYPEWADVKNWMTLDGEDEESYTWTEKDHDDFKEALKWFASKIYIYFEVSWSY